MSPVRRSLAFVAAALAAAANGPKYFMTILGGTHTGDAKGGTSPRQRALTEAAIAFFDDYLRGDTGALAALRAAATQPGLTTLDAQP